MSLCREKLVYSSSWCVIWPLELNPTGNLHLDICAAMPMKVIKVSQITAAILLFLPQWAYFWKMNPYPVSLIYLRFVFSFTTRSWFTGHLEEVWATEDGFAKAESTIMAKTKERMNRLFFGISVGEDRKRDHTHVLGQLLLTRKLQDSSFLQVWAPEEDFPNNHAGDF